MLVVETNSVLTKLVGLTIVRRVRDETVMAEHETDGGVDGVSGSFKRGRYAAGLQTRRAILEVASRLFRERGIAGVSKSDIAREAGVFPSQLGYYFETKEALFVEAACREVLHLA